MTLSAYDLAYQHVQTLVSQFEAGQKHFLSAAYQEEEARRDFIDKFWIALGWDVNHDRQTDPYAQEVKVERGVTMGAEVSIPDCWVHSPAQITWPARRVPDAPS